MSKKMAAVDYYAGVCCPEHPDAPLVEDYRAGDQVCPECGLVVGDRVIDVGVEWRTFSNGEKGGGEDPSRVGGPENPWLNGSDLTTIIGGGGGKGRAAFDEAGVSKYRNIRRSKMMSSTDRALLNGFKEISLMGDRLNLPRIVVDEAKNTFKRVQDGKSLKGRSSDAIASASVYIACCREGVPRTLKEICAVSSNCSEKKIRRCFKAISGGLGLDSSVEGNITSGAFMSRFCSNLGLPIKVQKGATTIAARAVQMDLVPGRSPISVAAAAIYMASQGSEVKRSKKEIGGVAGVSESTIRTCYKLMVSRAQELFPDYFNFWTPVDQLPRA